MTMFACIICLYFIIFIMKNYKKSITWIYPQIFMRTTIFSIVFDIGYFAKVGSFVIEYNYFFTILNVFFAFIYLLNKKISIINIKSTFILVFVILFSFFLNFFVFDSVQSVPFDKEWDTYILENIPLPYTKVSIKSTLQLIRIILFIFELSILYECVDSKFISSFTNKMIFIFPYIIFMSLLEIVMYNLFDFFNYRYLLMSFFGFSDSTYLTPREIQNIYMPMMFMREPSSYAYMLLFFGVSCIVNIFINPINKKKSKIYFFVVIILMALSTSFSAYIYIFTLLFLYIYLFRKKVKLRNISYLIVFLSLGMVLFFIVEDSFFSRLESILSIINGDNNYQSFSSNYIRIKSIMNNLNLFFKHPLFGYGVGSFYCFSSIVTLLANIGIIGVLVYVSFIKNLTNKVFLVHYTSFLSLFLIICTHCVTGHMSNLIYLEKIVFLFISFKFLSIISNNKQKGLFNYAI